MSICVIVNRTAGSADYIDAVRDIEDVEWRQPGDQNDVAMLAMRAAEEGFEVVAAAGGDGTVCAVVNGLMKASRRPVLGIIPTGTGNDMARTLALPADPGDSLALLKQGERRLLDLYSVHSAAETIYGINVSAGGFSGQVNEALTTEMKASWGPLAYLIGAASVLSEMHSYDLYLTLDDEPPEVVSAVNVIVANGRTVAGGRRVAPLADPEDGLLDVVVVRTGSVVELGDAAARLVTGGFLNSRIVSHWRARKVRVESEPGMWFNVDGELLTNEPLSFHVEPRALEVVVGAGYRRDVEVGSRLPGG